MHGQNHIKFMYWDVSQQFFIATWNSIMALVCKKYHRLHDMLLPVVLSKVFTTSYTNPENFNLYHLKSHIPSIVTGQENKYGTCLGNL